MTAPVDLHPPIVNPRILEYDVDGGYIMNIPAVIQLMKHGDSERSRLVYRRYVEKYRAMEGQPLSHQEREERAFRLAWNEVANEVGMAHLVK